MFFSNTHGYLNGSAKTSERKQEDENSSPTHKTFSADLDRRIDASIKNIQNMQHARENNSGLGHAKETEEEFLQVRKPGSAVHSEGVSKRSNRARSRRSVGAADRETIKQNGRNWDGHGRSRGRRRSIGTTTRTIEAETAPIDNWANFVDSFDDEKPVKTATTPPRSRRAAGNRKATAWTNRAKQGEEVVHQITWHRQPTKGRQKQMSRSPMRRNHNGPHRGRRNRSLSRSDHSQDFAMSPGTPSGRSLRRGRRAIPVTSVDDSSLPTAPKLGEGNSDTAGKRSAADSGMQRSAHDRTIPLSPDSARSPQDPTGKSNESSEDGDPTLPTAPVAPEETKNELLDDSSRSEETHITWQRVPQKWGLSVRNKKKEGDKQPLIASSALEDTKREELDHSTNSEEMHISWQRIPQKWGVSVRSKKKADDSKRPKADDGLEDSEAKTSVRGSRSQEMQISWQRIPSVRNIGGPVKGKLVGNTNENGDTKPSTVAVEDTKDKILDHSSRAQEMQISWQRVPSVRNIGGPSKRKLAGSANKMDDAKLPKIPAVQEDIQDKTVDQGSRSQEIQISWHRVPGVRKIVGPATEKLGKLVGNMKKSDNAKSGVEGTKDKKLGHVQEMQISWQRVPSGRKIMGPPEEKLGKLLESINKGDYAELPSSAVGPKKTKGKTLDGRKARSPEMQISWQRVPSVRKLAAPPTGELGKMVGNSDQNNEEKLTTGSAGPEDTKDDALDKSSRSEEMQIITQQWLPDTRKYVGPPKAAPAPIIWRNRRATKAPISMQSKRPQQASARVRAQASMHSRSTNRKRVSGDRLMRRSTHNSTVVPAAERNGATKDDALDRSSRSTRSTGMQMTWRQEPNSRQHLGPAKKTQVSIHIGNRSPKSQGKRVAHSRNIHQRMQSSGNSRRERRVQRANSAEGEALPLAPMAATGGDQVSQDGIGEIAKLLERSNKLEQDKEWRKVRDRGSRVRSRRRARSPARAPRQQTVPTHWQRNEPVMVG